MRACVLISWYYGRCCWHVHECTMMIVPWFNFSYRTMNACTWRGVMYCTITMNGAVYAMVQLCE